MSEVEYCPDCHAVIGQPHKPGCELPWLTKDWRPSDPAVARIAHEYGVAADTARRWMRAGRFGSDA